MSIEIPASIGRCADMLHDYEELYHAMQKEVDAVKAKATLLREHIINNLSKSEDTGAAGLRYRVQVVTKRKLTVKEWGLLHSWIRKNDRFDMLQKRLAEKAAEDWCLDPDNAGRLLPGTEAINVPTLSLTKI